MQRRLLILTVAQFILLAGVGQDDARRCSGNITADTTMPAFLLCAAASFGGLLPVVYCMRMAQDAGVNMLLAPCDAFFFFSLWSSLLWRAYCHRHWQHAIYHGIYRHLADHLWTVAFVKMCAGGAYGSNCADESVCSRTSMRQENSRLTYGLSG